jgi:glycerol-3-phosphate dehydrogenase
MAQDAVDRVVTRLGRGGHCVTTGLPLVGAAGLTDDGLPPRLRRRFGAEAAAVASCGPVEPIAADAPALRCEVAWAVAAEGAMTADDVDRRLRLDVVPAWRDASRAYVDEVLSAAR